MPLRAFTPAIGLQRLPMRSSVKDPVLLPAGRLALDDCVQLKLPEMASELGAGLVLSEMLPAKKDGVFPRQ